MNGKPKRQEVTSGRLAGTLEMSRQTAGGGPPDAAFSLYSTDSEEQVSTLHRGLDRCAVLLDHILQADTAGLTSLTEGATRAKPATPAGRKTLKKVPGKAVKGGAARSRATTSLGKRATTKTGLSSSGLHGRTSSTPTATKTCAAAAQSGPRPRPLQRRGGRGPLPLDPPPVTEPLHAKRQVVSAVPREGRQGEGDEEDFVPVRDPGPHSSGAHLPRPVEEQEEEQEEASSSRRDLCSSAGRTRPAKTVGGLLDELKAAVAGRGSVVEQLLVGLEQILSSQQVGVEPSAPSAEAGVVSLQGELESAQARLQQLQEDLGELRQALQDTQSQLKDVKAENALLKTDLEFHRLKLLDSERVNSELASLAQHRLKEMEKLQSLLQSAADAPTDRITGFLRSLRQAEPCTEHVQTEGDQELQELRSTTPGGRLGQSDRESQDQLRGCVRRIRSPSLCDSASLWSSWSARSTSTFDTRDEAAFRDGLAALDASIASLQRTFQLDLRRC